MKRKMFNITLRFLSLIIIVTVVFYFVGCVTLNEYYGYSLKKETLDDEITILNGTNSDNLYESSLVKKVEISAHSEKTRMGITNVNYKTVKKFMIEFDIETENESGHSIRHEFGVPYKCIHKKYRLPQFIDERSEVVAVLART